MRLLSKQYWFSSAGFYVGLIVLGYSPLLVFLGDSLYELHRRWMQFDGAYSHGYLLVVICLIFILDRFPEMIRVQKTNIIWALTSVIPSCMWVLGYLTQINVFQQLTLPMFFGCLLLTVFGYQAVLKVLFPLCLLFLAIPVWEVLLPPLRDMTTFVSTAGVRLLNIPAFIDGFSFTLPYGVVHIAGSCAGLSYFLMGLVLSSLNAHYRGFNAWHATWTILLMAFLAIVGNWIRVFALILIAYYSEMQNSLVYEHGSFGWWIFAGVFFVYLFVIHNVPEHHSSVQDITDVYNRRAIVQSVGSVVVVLVLSLLLPLLVISHSFQAPLAGQKSSEEYLTTLVTIPTENGRREFTPYYVGYDQEAYWQVDALGKRWTIGRLLYVTQEQGKELVADGNRLSESDMVSLTIIQDGPREYGVYALTKEKRLVVATNIIGAETETQALKSKLRQFLEGIQGRSQVALWFASVNCTSRDCSDELNLVRKNPTLLSSWLNQVVLY